MPRTIYDIKEIIEIEGGIKQVKDVNEYLEYGWMLLSTYKISSQNDNQLIVYCLGR